MNKIRTGDEVVVITGRSRGKKGKVLRSFPIQERIIIEGVNLRKKHIRPRRAGEKGQTVEVPSPLHISNVKLVCPKCSAASKVGFRQEGNEKVRVCKKCGSTVK